MNDQVDRAQIGIGLRQRRQDAIGWLSIELGTLARCTPPVDGSSIMRSVKVPPTSTPIMCLDSFSGIEEDRFLCV